MHHRLGRLLAACCSAASAELSGVTQPVARWVLISREMSASGQVPAKLHHVIDKFCESFWKVRT